MHIHEVAKKIKRDKRGTLGGGNLGQYEKIGRDAFSMLINNGLLPDHKVLDFACGSLRIGYWLVRFLDKGCYFAIDPNRKFIEAGKEIVFGDDVVREKAPTFDFNADCNASVFGVKFDYVVSRSFLTHTPVRVTEKLLRSVAANGGRMFASYWREDSDFLKGNKMHTRVEDLAPDDLQWRAVMSYRRETMAAAADRCGLVFEELPRRQINGQTWAKFTLKS